MIFYRKTTANKKRNFIFPIRIWIYSSYILVNSRHCTKLWVKAYITEMNSTSILELKEWKFEWEVKIFEDIEILENFTCFWSRIRRLLVLTILGILGFFYTKGKKRILGILNPLKSIRNSGTLENLGNPMNLTWVSAMNHKKISPSLDSLDSQCISRIINGFRIPKILFSLLSWKSWEYIGNPGNPIGIRLFPLDFTPFTSWIL